MIVHFDTEKLATEHLQKSAFHLIENGRWVSKDGTVSASIHPASGEVVCIFFQEITA